MEQLEPEPAADDVAPHVAIVVEEVQMGNYSQVLECHKKQNSAFRSLHSLELECHIRQEYCMHQLVDCRELKVN